MLQKSTILNKKILFVYYVRHYESFILYYLIFIFEGISILLNCRHIYVIQSWSHLNRKLLASYLAFVANVRHKQ